MGALQQALLGTQGRPAGYYEGVAGTDGSGTGYVVGTYGSISPTTFPFAGGATVRLLLEDGSPRVLFEISGVQANSGWTSVDINGTVLSRADATYSNPAGSLTRWVWTGISGLLANGAPFVVQFTP